MPEPLFIEDLVDGLLARPRPRSERLLDPGLEVPQTRAQVRDVFASSGPVYRVSLTPALESGWADAVHDELPDVRFEAEGPQGLARATLDTGAVALSGLVGWLSSSDAAARHRALVGWPGGKREVSAVTVDVLAQRQGTSGGPSTPSPPRTLVAIYQLSAGIGPKEGATLRLRPAGGAAVFGMPPDFNASVLFAGPGVVWDLTRLHEWALEPRWLVVASYTFG